jgi:WD40 repeat protein/uncharacterized caspase-like protein
MARFRAYPRGVIAAIGLVLLIMLEAQDVRAQDEPAGLYQQPVLAVHPGKHVASIVRADVDAQGAFAVTGSHDKTVRVWSLDPLQLVTTIRIPAGPDHIGKVYAVTISPDSSTIAAGGWTRARGEQEQIYVFSRSGKLLKRIEGLPNVVLYLTFSRDGRYLAAGLGGRDGIRIYDGQQEWRETAGDRDYGGQIYGLDFAGDGRLATTSFDGKVRLYDAGFVPIAKRLMARSNRPFGIAFSPAGDRLAVGFDGTPAVTLLDGRTLNALASPDVSNIDNGDLAEVAWSHNGRILYAGSQYDGPDDKNPVVAWTDGGLGARNLLFSGATSIIATIMPLSSGNVLVAAADPHLALLRLDGAIAGRAEPATFDARYNERTLAVSHDGSVVDFRYKRGEGTVARFDLRELKLTTARPPDELTITPRQNGLAISNWENSESPTLGGVTLGLSQYEISYSLAIDAAGQSFVLGTNWSLRRYDANGKLLWRRVAPDSVRAVNITGDGRMIVAAYADGTIRWHRLDDGRELLAFMPLADRVNWVAWTPDGIYSATPGSHGVLRWHVNRGWDSPADAFRVSEIPGFNRPAVLPLVIKVMDQVQALGLAVQAELREAVRLRTGAKIAPGALLHVVSIGISDYGDKAAQLDLRFADDDAEDLLQSLLATQTGLYADIMEQYLANEDATRSGILKALTKVREALKASPEGRDLVVVSFSGHGAIIDGRYYLLPHDVDARVTEEIPSTALSVDDLRSALLPLGERARVLVLLDSCRSGAVSGAGTPLGGNAGLIRSALAATNITVLTSSQSAELSREDAAWENGAFTEALLKALGREADSNHNGLIDINELNAAAGDELLRLTDQKQRLGMEVRFRDNVFVAGP